MGVFWAVAAFAVGLGIVVIGLGIVVIWLWWATTEPGVRSV
jgi:hypothetical protein